MDRAGSYDPLAQHSDLYGVMLAALQRDIPWKKDDKTDDKFDRLMEVNVLLPKQLSGSTRSAVSGASGSKRKSEESQDSEARKQKRSKKATGLLRGQQEKLTDSVDDPAGEISVLLPVAEDFESGSIQGY